MDNSVARILVVDDEFGIREGCRKTLLMEKYHVECADNGLAGLELFKSSGFDLVLIDLNMPKMGGIELINEIHKLDEDAVLIVITAFASIETAVEATKGGAYSYIPKPFTPDELILAVKNGLEKRILSFEAKKFKEEREKHLLEINYERSKLNTVIDCMADGVLVVNSANQIVLRNDAINNILTNLNEAPVPSPLDGTLGCQELEEFIINTLVKNDYRTIIHKEIKIDDKTYMANISPVIEESGETLGVVTILNDITELKKLEIAKSMFVSMVSHEIKSPLAAIETFLNCVLDNLIDPNPENIKTMMQKALSRASSLRNLVNDLLNLTAIETGKFTLKRIPIKLSQTIKDVTELYKDKAKEKNISITFNSIDDAENYSIMADKNAFQSIISNLVDNAIKYTGIDGKVDVEIVKTGNNLKATIKDTGIGMSEEEKLKVFDEFYRASNDFTRGIPGTGLGLSLVKKLVEMHNARIVVESVFGEGSSFIILFPILK